ncbi:MAG: CpcT/CpeT family chromophore lyase [Bacteroidota bacterium]
MIRLAFLSVLTVSVFACQEKSSKASPTESSISTAHIIPTQLKERKFTYLEREIEYLMRIWPGEYDNVEQLDFDKMANSSRDEKIEHKRVHSFIREMDMPQFGNYVIYEESYENDNPEDISNQRLYVLSADEKGEGIRLKVFNLLNPKALLSVQKDLKGIEKLAIEDARLTAGCDMLVWREGMEYRGQSLDKSCLKQVDGESYVMDYQMRIGEGTYAFEDVKYDPATAKYLAEKSSPYLMEKARCFVCMIDFPREKNGRPVETKYYIQIHDQGGKFEFDYSDGRHMVLGMRNTWSFGMQRETFVIFIQEGSQKGPTLIYSWGEPGADRIGFNPGWIRVQCDLDTPRNRELQHYLRPDS